MPKKSNQATASAPQPAIGTDPRGGRTWVFAAGGVAFAAVVLALIIAGRNTPTAPPAPSPTPATPASPAPSSSSAPAAAPGKDTNAPEMNYMETNKAVMVTVELDFGAKPPTIAEAINEIERRYEPEDGKGRTFAILDAYGEPTADGKLHMSMHVSSEKPGMGYLYFKRTGQMLWRTRITPGQEAPPLGGKTLRIMLDEGNGKTHLLDGSNNPKTILDAIVNDMKVPVRDVWPDGAEREMTFIYSACGCPVKVMARRTGNTTVRTKELPVIFPDDPTAGMAIRRLMGW